MTAADLHTEVALARVSPQQRQLRSLTLQNIRRHRHLRYRDVRAQRDAHAPKGQVTHGGQRRHVQLTSKVQLFF